MKNKASRTPQGEVLVLIEYSSIYDGWSVLQTISGDYYNRWENEDGTGPEPGYENRYYRTDSIIKALYARDAELSAQRNGEPDA